MSARLARKPIRIVLADDHTLFRAGVRSLLEQMPDMEVVGEAADGRDAVKVVAELQPDIVLMDIAMPGMNGLEATAYLSRECPHVHPIILSMHADGRYAARAIRAGARGFLVKDAATTDLEKAIHAVIRGETYLSASIAHHVLEDYRRRLKGKPPSDVSLSEELAAIPPRQREILQLVAEGNTSKEIAALLHLSEKTVEVHRTRLMQRLGVHDVAGVVRHAVRLGLIKVDE